MDEIVIAIDFGTTGSAAAFQFKTSQSGKVLTDLIIEWPCAPDDTPRVKMPTEVCYPAQPENRVVTSDDTNRMVKSRRSKKAVDCLTGFEIFPGEKRVQCCKLLLAKGQNIPVFVSQHETKMELKGNDRNGMTVCTDFLKRFLDYIVLDFLARRFSKQTVYAAKKTFVVSVPTAFDMGARNAICHAFRSTGYGSPQLILEPVAAAYHVIKELGTTLSPHNVVMIVDAGGGSVDLAAVEIICLEPNLKLTITGKGCGDICGAAIIDDNVEKLIIETLGQSKFTLMKRGNPASWSEFLQHFRLHAKRSITSGSVNQWILPLNGVDDKHVMQNRIKLSSDQIRETFENSINSIKQLIENYDRHLRENLGKHISQIIMAGGLGGSRYLNEQLDKRLMETTFKDRGVKLMVCKDTESAVVRGALDAFVQGHVEKLDFSSDNLGISIDCSDYYQNTVERKVPARQDGETITWMIKRGDAFFADDKYTYEIVTQAREFEIEVFKWPKALGDSARTIKRDKMDSDPVALQKIELVDESEEDLKDVKRIVAAANKPAKKRKRATKRHFVKEKVIFRMFAHKGRVILEVEQAGKGVLAAIPFPLSVDK